jgi:hypothetical protein
VPASQYIFWRLFGRVGDTLILSVSALDFFVGPFLDFSFEDAGALRLIKVGDLEYLSGIHPRIGLAAHHRHPTQSVHGHKVNLA